MNNEVRKLIKGLEPYDWEQRINKHGKRVVYVRFAAPVKVKKMTVMA